MKPTEGYVTYDDLNEVLEDASSEEIEEFLEKISELGIEIFEAVELKTVIGDFGGAKNWEQEGNNEHTVFGLRSAPWTPPREGNERYFEATFDGYPLSLRQVEDLLFERGIDICHETVRFWWNLFGPMFAAEIRRR